MDPPDDILLCPITLALFQDPVVAQDGHTYERKAIEKWIERAGTSPITSQTLSLEHLYPNFAIKKAVDQFENTLKAKKYQYTLDVDIKKKKGRPLFQTFGKTIYHAEWIPNNQNRSEIILLKIDGARANKEASFYVKLSLHSHIVRTFGFVRDPDGDPNAILLLQEYATEGSLYELIIERKKALDEKILIEIFSQIVDAMSYLVLNHIVHGDLACRNVLVFRFDEQNSHRIVVKVTDFGLSRYSQLYGQTSAVARTTLSIIPIRSSAPEILSSTVKPEDYTEKSDVYAFGVLMWEAYSRGAIPWSDVSDDDSVIKQILSEKILSQPKNCSDQYWSIMKKTWAKLPNNRPTFDQLKQMFKEQHNDKPTVPSRQKSPSLVTPAWYGTRTTQSVSENPRDMSYRSTQVQSKATETSIGRHDDLLGKMIVLKGTTYIIKGSVNCNGFRMFALESDKKMAAYDGSCPGCHGQHVMLAQGRGYYALADKICEALQTQKREEEDARGPPPLTQLTHFTGSYPPLDKILAGQNKGIEGDSNSCYMDATIFCMFAYNDVFDSLLYQNVNKDMAPLQEILRDYVVHVLRAPDGFVRRHAMYYLRLELYKATGDKSFIDKEKDPSEFLKAFEKTFGFEPIKTIHPSDTPRPNLSNVTNNIVWEMFDMNPHTLLSTSIGQMFRNSLAEIPARLLTIPPVLILIAPRHERGKRSYPYIVPDRQIVLDNDSLQLFCTKCKKTNPRSEAPIDFFTCDKCQRDVQQRSTDAMIECYCSGCLKEKHENSGSSARYDHSVKKVEAKKHKLDLFAVLCIQTSHYVAFVKCKTQQGGAEWLFFDSMSDRINNQTNIPSVTRVRDFESWLDEPMRNKNFFEDLERTVRDSRPTSQKFSEDEMRRLRLFRDGAFFFYENSTANYQ